MPALGRPSMQAKHSLLTLLCIGFVLALVMLPMASGEPAHAAGPAFPGTIGFVPTTISLAPASGPTGTRVILRGTGFDPLIGQGVAGLRWRGTPSSLMVAQLRSDGTFTAPPRLR